MNKELIAKAKAAKNAEELLELAKANNVEMTAEEAKTYFAQLNTKGAVADDELDAVAGGSFCDPKAKAIASGAHFRFTDGTKCPKCNWPSARARSNGSRLVVTCLSCGTEINRHPSTDIVELI